MRVGAKSFIVGGNDICSAIKDGSADAAAVEARNIRWFPRYALLAKALALVFSFNPLLRSTSFFCYNRA